MVRWFRKQWVSACVQNHFFHFAILLYVKLFPLNVVTRMLCPAA